MTREEAIEQLQYCKGLIKKNGQVYLDERDFPLLDMAIEALQAEQEDEPKFYDEDDYWNGRVPTHGRLIDADALIKAFEGCMQLSEDTIIRTIRIAPTVQADRPHGEWIEREDYNGDNYYDCSVMRGEDE